MNDSNPLPPGGMALTSGVAVCVSKVLAGGKRAVLQGRKFYVSPAMHQLIAGAASSEELAVILSKIEVIEIPEFTPPEWAAMRVHSDRVGTSEFERDIILRRMGL